MDTRVVNTKPGLKERHAAMTLGLAWQTSYQPREAVFPMDHHEGIVVHDWNAFEDHFRMTVDAYWKVQGEKERKLYAVIDAFAQNNGQLGVSDVRYVNALKVFAQCFTPLGAMAHRGYAQVARQFGGEGLRVACLMHSADALRHHQTQTHTFSIYNKYFNGLHDSNRAFDHAWYCAPAKSYVEDALSAGPFEYLVAFGFGFDCIVGNLLLAPFMSGCAHNGDLATVTAGFSAQGDRCRHMTTGLESIRFMLEQDAANLPLVQRWVDKWFWRAYRLTALVAMMQDYMLPRRGACWKDTWDLYVERSVGALFDDLAALGVRKPSGWADARAGKDHIGHQAWNACYTYGSTTAFHTWVPEPDELKWLSARYPGSFDKYYRPRLEYYAQRAGAGKRFYNSTPPMTCSVCLFPMVFTEADNPRWIAYRESTFEGQTHHTCSDGCRAIFDHQPGKYAQVRLPAQRFLHLLKQTQGDGRDDGTVAVRDDGMVAGQDNLDIIGSDDERNFAGWGGGRNPIEGHL